MTTCWEFNFKCEGSGSIGLCANKQILINHDGYYKHVDLDTVQGHLTIWTVLITFIEALAPLANLKLASAFVSIIV